MMGHLQEAVNSTGFQVLNTYLKNLNYILQMASGNYSLVWFPPRVKRKL